VLSYRKSAATIEPTSEVPKENKEKRNRNPKWNNEDDLSLLRLIEKNDFAWNNVYDAFKNYEHRDKENSVTLEKRWKNIKLHSSPYLKPFKYTKYTPTDTRKKSKEQLRADEAVWAENRSKAEEIFEECSVLIAKLKEKEHKEV